MDINKMKVGLSYIFFENQKIDKMTKKQVLNYIEAADMDQLKLLALDGDIHSELTKEARKIINVRFNENIELVNKLDKAALQGIKELVKLKEGWKLGALIGFLTPIPGGALVGGVIGHWMEQNKKKLEAYCSKQKDPNECMSAGRKAMQLKLSQAKAKQKK